MLAQGYKFEKEKSSCSCSGELSLKNPDFSPWTPRNPSDMGPG